MKVSQPSRRKPPYGPNIVRAWFDTVLQPVLRGLETERSFVVRHDWTFRFHRQTLEYMAPIAEHVAARDNLEQFLSFFPAIEGLVGEHDRAVKRLLETCVALHAAISKSRLFQEAFQAVEAETPAVLGVEFSSFFGGYPTREDLGGFLAEYLVNNIQDLPDYYTTARLWNQFRGRFVPVLAVPEVAAHRLEAENCGGQLLKTTERLTGAFKAKRSELSLAKDVPFIAETTSAY